MNQTMQTVAVNKELLDKVRAIAKQEGRKLSFVVERALAEHLANIQHAEDRAALGIMHRDERRDKAGKERRDRA